MSAIPIIEPLDTRRLLSGAAVPSFGRDGVVITGTLHPGDVGGTVLPYGDHGGFFIEDQNHLLTRYLPNGSIDTRFKPLNPANAGRESVRETFEFFAPAADGSVYVIRQFHPDPDPISVDTTSISIQHYTSRGRLDRSFGKNGVYSLDFFETETGVSNVYVAKDNSLYFAASFYADNFYPSFDYDLMHVAADGDDAKTETATLNSSGSILLSQSGEVYALSDHDVTAYKPNLTVDTVFGNKGTVTLTQTAEQGAIGVDGDVTLLTSGRDDASEAKDQIVRLTAAGKFDPNFGKGGVAVLPDGAVSGAFSNFVLEPDNTLLLASYYPSSTTYGENYVYPVIVEIDSAGRLKQSGFKHGANQRLISSAGTPAYDSDNALVNDHFLQLVPMPNGEILAAFTARQKVGDHYRLVSVLEEFTGT